MASGLGEDLFNLLCDVSDDSVFGLAAHDATAEKDRDFGCSSHLFYVGKDNKAVMVDVTPNDADNKTTVSAYNVTDNESIFEIAKDENGHYSFTNNDKISYTHGIRLCSKLIKANALLLV